MKYISIMFFLLLFIPLNSITCNVNGSVDKDIVTYNSSNIVKSVEGYAGPTPLKVYVKNGKIIKVELLRNEESPRYLYFIKNSELLNKWNGMTFKQVINDDVDAISGATYTSNSIIETMKEMARHIIKTRKK